jgi:preprotein translocase subunit SecF
VIALRRVARGENAINFARWWPRAVALSAVLLVLSIGSLYFRGLNLGIDFEGGTSWEVATVDASVSTTREVLEPLGEGNAKIQIVSSPSGAEVIRVQSSLDDPGAQGEVRQALADLAGVDVTEVSVSTVGPSWGAEITRSAVRALVVFMVVLLIYLSFRLQWQMALGAIISLVHDLVICIGFYSIFQFEVTPGTVIAFLTILGFSIYDTVVVFDKVKENEGRVSVGGRLTYTEMVSLSMNEVLIRSINTTIASLLPVIAILVVGSGIYGAVTLQEFGVALLVGLLLGAYSSIFVAAPALTFLKERQTRFRTVRERLEATRPTEPVVPIASSGPVLDGPADPAAPGHDVVVRPAAPSAARAPTGAIPPRPRKKGKKR